MADSKEVQEKLNRLKMDAQGIKDVFTILIKGLGCDGEEIQKEQIVSILWMLQGYQEQILYKLDEVQETISD